MSRMTRMVLVAMALTGMPAGFAAAAAAAAAPDADSNLSQQQTEQRLQAAQKRLEEAANEVAELSMSLNDRAGTQTRRIVRARVQRPMLGMAIDPQEGGDNGVRIVSVSPGGAAEAAGLKANDVVTSFDGKALKREAGRSPQQQLLDLIAEAKSGEAVSLEYRRDGKTATTKVTPRRMTEVVSAIPEINMRMPELLDDFDVGEFHFARRNAGGFGAAELVELSAGLGSYFGTDKGLLVVRAPEDQQLKLQDGDVILDIDGRVPGSAAHAYQILNSYRAGEQLKLRIMRQKKRMELAIQMPERATPSRGRRSIMGVPGVPVPPTPPVPVRPRSDDDRA